MRWSFSLSNLLQNVDVELLLGQELLQASVLFLKLLQLFELILLHTTVLAAPAVVGLFTDLDLFDRFLDGGSLSGERFYYSRHRRRSQIGNRPPVAYLANVLDHPELTYSVASTA
jgi:hypothetical protein